MKVTLESNLKSIACLYPEILVIIFGHLNVRDKGRAARVCRTWRDAAYDKSVWRGVEARLHLRRSNPYLLASLVRRGIRRVQVLGLKRPLRELIQGVPGLESLNLQGCYNLTDESFEHAFSQVSSDISLLNLSMCKQITDKTLDRVYRFIPNIKTLDLSGCCNLTNTSLHLIGVGLKNLKELKLRSCNYITDYGIMYIAGTEPDSTNSPTKPPLLLETLCLQDCQNITDDGLKHLSLGMPSLKCLNLSFCSGISDSGLKYVARLPSLQDLNLCSCDITDTGMINLTEVGGSKIRALNISFCNKITDHGIFHISQGLYQLRILNLNSSLISDEGIYRITRTLNELHTLKLGQCRNITDKSLLLISQKLHNLENIDLYGCLVSTVGLEKIYQMQKVKSMNLVHLYQKQS